MNGSRWQPGDQFPAVAGPHVNHVVRVLGVREAYQGYDKIRALCDCGVTWSFIHHWNRWSA